MHVQVTTVSTATHPAALLVANAQAAARNNDIGTVRACLHQLADLLGPDRTEGCLEEPPARGGLAGWQVRRIERHVDANLERTISVDELATIARLSSGHFSRVFKASVGDTPHTFITRRRVERAQFLMLTTAETLGQIAAACGLTDQAHLTRLFRRFVGETPMAWRRTWQQAA